VRTLIGQAVTELHLGRLDEAETALCEAIAKEPACADAIANLLVLSVIAGKNVEDLTG
jgi:coatomer protein complex subunit epsilon